MAADRARDLLKYVWCAHGAVVMYVPCAAPSCASQVIHLELGAAFQALWCEFLESRGVAKEYTRLRREANPSPVDAAPEAAQPSDPPQTIALDDPRLAALCEDETEARGHVYTLESRQLNFALRPFLGDGATLFWLIGSDDGGSTGSAEIPAVRAGRGRAVLWNEMLLFFSYGPWVTELLSMDGGWSSTVGGWSSTDGGWGSTDGG